MTIASLNYQTPSFKGMSKTENGTPYHKSHAGAIIGGTYAGLHVLDCFSKSNKKGPVASLAMAATGLGCGLLIDNIRNNNAKEAAEQIQQFGINNAMAINPNIRFTDTNTPYYKSNDGGKTGGLLGLGVGTITVASTFLNDKTTKVLMDKLPGKGKATVIALTSAVALPLFALGGWIMGKITDYCNNKSAKKASMEQYRQQAGFVA